MRFPVFLLPLALFVLLLIPALQNIPPDYPLLDGHFYSESTIQTMGHLRGYAVEDRDGIPFWSEYQRFGGPAALGYPISRRFVLDGFTVQATANVVMQRHPDDKKVYFLNLLDVLHAHGDDAWLLRNAGIPPVQTTWPEEQNKSVDQIAQQRLAMLQSESPAIWDLYQRTPDALDLFGLPTSTAFNAGGAVVVRFQRAVMQQWLQTTPFAQQGQVTLADSAYLVMRMRLFGDGTLAEISPLSAIPGALLRGFALVFIKQASVQQTAQHVGLNSPSPEQFLGLSPEDAGHDEHGAADVSGGSLRRPSREVGRRRAWREWR